METDTGEKSRSNDLIHLLLLIAIPGIGFNLYYKYDRYYLGEPLVAKQIFIQDKPEYIYSKNGTSRYTFKGTNYNCRFWLSEGALETITDNENVKKEIESVNTGDTIAIKIRQMDELKLQDSTARPRVIEFLKGNNTIISAIQVQGKDRMSLYLNFGLPILCLLIWIFVLVSRQIIKRIEIT